jgi:Leucine-rich repeat (LRR) protein
MIRLVLLISVIISLASCSSTYTSKTVEYTTTEKSPKKVIRLDLSKHDLEHLPSDFNKYENLKFLNLSNNPNLDFASIGEFLIKLKSLEVLKLDSNGLNSLPIGLEQIMSIKHISLSNNSELDFDETFLRLKHLPFLEKINLSHNKLTQLPSSVAELQELKNIRLSYNMIKDSASLYNLSRLSKLKFLWLDHNRISVLPKTIGDLSQISELYLGDNSIKTLPQRITNCKNLRILYLGNNQFDHLPNEVLDMKLRMLVLYGNNISNIPQSYKNLKSSFKILILDNNYLDDVQQKVAKKYFTGFFMLSLKNQQ